MSSTLGFSTGDSKEVVLQKSLESLEAKYQELKGRNQKLLEHVQSREKDYQKDMDALKKKLDDQKKETRAFEDQTIQLKYEVTSLKKREAKNLEQIESLKTLVKKYQAQLKGENSTTTKSLKPFTMNNLNCYDVRDSTSTVDSDIQKSSPPCARKNSPVKQASAASIVFGNSDPQSEREIFDAADFKVQRSQYIKSLQNLDIENKITGLDSNGDRTKQLRFNFQKKGTLDQENIDEVMSEESPVPTLAKKKGVFETKPFSPDKAPTSSFSLAKRGSLYAEDPQYLDKFNKLSQNIVSLAFKPEIAIEVGEPGKEIAATILSPMKSPDQGSPDLYKKTLMKYTSKSRKMSLFSISSPLKDQKSPAPNQPKLFEDFFVIGPTKEELQNFINENPEKIKGSLPPRIIFNYPSDYTLLSQPPRSSIPDFTFPFGVDVGKIRSTQSFSGLNSIIYTSSDYEQKNKCFVFPLLSAHLEGQNNFGSDMGEIIQTSNPDQLIYLVCITFKDFISMSDQTEGKKNLQQVKYWEVTKAMCFMTYYPFTNFFFDVLIKVLNMLKVERMVKISELDPQDLSRHEAVDTGFTSNFLETTIKKNLKSLLQTKIPSFGSTLNFKLLGSFTEIPLTFSLQQEKFAFTMEANWACTMIFRYISYKDLLWFFTAILLERKLVFLSNNIHLLTATLFVLRSLIKPFNYPFPLIFNLPEVLMVYCDAPGAALIGINKGEEYLKENCLHEEYPSCTFICLDEEKMYIEPENDLLPVTFKDFERPLITNYTKLNSNFNRNFITSKKKLKPSSKVENLKISEDAEEREKSLSILELFKTTLENKLIKHVPLKPIYKKPDELDYDEIGKIMLSKAKEVDKKFLKEFLKTQIWAYYLEQHYEGFDLNQGK